MQHGPSVRGRPVALAVGEQVHLRRLGTRHPYANGPHPPSDVAAHLVGDAKWAPFCYANDHTVSNDIIVVPLQPQVSEARIVPRRPHNLASHVSRSFPSNPALVS